MSFGMGKEESQKENEMKDFMAFCGLDCEVCEARIATENNDEALREKVAKLWSELNGVEITPEMIHCTGCRMPGAKTPYSDSLCPIRKCAMSRHLETCGNCGEMASCGELAQIIGNNAEALENLQKL